VVFGPKVSSEIVLEEPISNLRAFLSAKELLGYVKKLRRNNGRIKLQSVWYLTMEREFSTLRVWEP
jgi:hypothetical protein